jgi:hypothetical protein
MAGMGILTKTVLFLYEKPPLCNRFQMTLFFMVTQNRRLETRLEMPSLFDSLKRWLKRLSDLV